MKSAFDKIKAGLDDAVAFAGGDKSRGRLHEPIDFKALREQTGKTQEQFSTAYALPIGTVRDWEQKRRQPDAPARVLLSMIRVDPKGVEKLIAKA